jgi:hypothetical protein
MARGRTTWVLDRDTAQEPGGARLMQNQRLAHAMRDLKLTTSVPSSPGSEQPGSFVHRDSQLQQQLFTTSANTLLCKQYS